MNLIIVISRTAATTVAAVAGYASFNHIVSVATAAGEHRSVALVLPLSIDGLIVVGTMAMLEDKRAGRVPRPMARVALGFGIVATIAANVASADPTATARMVAAIPALAFLIAVEVLAHTGKVRAATAVASKPATKAVTDTPPSGTLTAVMDTVSDPSPATVKTTIRRPVKKASGRRQMTAAEKVAAAVTKLGADASMTALMKEAGVSESSVLRHRPKPAAAVNGHNHGEA